MSFKKIGKRIVLVGILLLITALYMIFRMESSPWALVVLALSILTNTVGTLYVLRK